MMSVYVRARNNESIESILGRLRRGMLRANTTAEIKNHQYFLKPSFKNHVKDQERKRKAFNLRKRDRMIKKFGPNYISPKKLIKVRRNDAI